MRSVTIDRKNIKIDTTEENENGKIIGAPYFISMDRIKTPLNLIWWIHHLCEKSWINPKKIRELINMTINHIQGYKVHSSEDRYIIDSPIKLVLWIHELCGGDKSTDNYKIKKVIEWRTEEMNIKMYEGQG